MTNATTIAAEGSKTTAEPPRPRRLTLDDLARWTSAELDAAYRGAAPPASLAALDGALPGRMLRVRHLERGPLGGALRLFAAWDGFLWRGKTFSSSGATGSGINRIYVPLALGRQDLFPFETRFEASALDGRPTVVLDYDRAENPPYIRRIRDELREVAPGTFLGPALWTTSSTPVLLLWFALAAAER